MSCRLVSGVPPVGGFVPFVPKLLHAPALRLPCAHNNACHEDKGSSVRRFSSGVTLIELLIAVLVLAIITAVAVPSYQDSIRKSRRSSAKVLLTTTAQLMERYYTENASYVDSKGNCGIALPINSEVDPGTGTAYYQIAAGGCEATANAFTLTATPLGSQAKDTTCGDFKLTNAGVKTAGSTSCW